MRYPIGPFDLDTAARRLSIDGRVVPMQPRVFDLLAHLARNAPRVVPKDELLDHVWSGVLVTEASLQRAASLLRASLREGGADHLLRSVARVGYALDIAPPVEAPAAEAGEPLALTRAVMARPAVCVLPLRIEAGDIDPTIADGLVAELIAGLSAWRLFPVISGFTSSRYRDPAKPLRAIAIEVDARYLLTGVVAAARGGLAIRLELVDAEADHLVWTHRLTLAAEELPLLEGEVSSAIVAAVMPELETAEWRRAARLQPEDASAWELAMRARWLIERFSRDHLATAIELAREAARRDPGFGLPHSLVAFARFQQAMAGWGGDATQSYGEVFRPTLDAAREAIALDPGSWMAQALVGVGELWTHHDHDMATAHVERAVTLNPTSSMAYHFAGCIAGFGGDLGKAIYNQQQVFRIDPFYPYSAVVEADLGLWHILSGDGGQAARWLDRSSARQPGYLRGLQRRIMLEGMSDGQAAALPQPLPEAALSLSQVEASYPFRDKAHKATFLAGYRRGLGALGAEPDGDGGRAAAAHRAAGADQ